MVAVKANLQEKNGPTSERLKRTHAYIVLEDPVVVVVDGGNSSFFWGGRYFEVKVFFNLYSGLNVSCGICCWDACTPFDFCWPAFLKQRRGKRVGADTLAS